MKKVVLDDSFLLYKQIFCTHEQLLSTDQQFFDLQPTCNCHISMNLEVNPMEKQGNEIQIKSKDERA
jgi:hypothetical protein